MASLYTWLKIRRNESGGTLDGGEHPGPNQCLLSGDRFVRSPGATNAELPLGSER
jgi:hypothetical protein